MNGSIYLVTRCDKSVTWAAGSHSSTSESNSLSFGFSVTEYTELGAARSYSMEKDSALTFRKGPQLSKTEETLAPHNQCNFMRGYKVSVRSGIRRLKGPTKLESTNKIEDTSPNDLIPGANGRSVPFGHESKWIPPSGRGSNYNGGRWSRDGGSTSEPEDDQQMKDDDPDAIIEMTPSDLKASLTLLSVAFG